MSKDYLIVEGDRPDQPQSEPYDSLHTPQVRFDSLSERNKPYFNIGKQNGGTSAMTVDLACHHVIPWKILYKFWNSLINRENFVLARKYLALFGVPQTKTVNMKKDMLNNKLKKSDFMTAMCWKPNNIVRGPMHRSDDPAYKPEADLMSQIDFQSVDSQFYKGRLPLLCEAGRNMVRFIDDGNEITAQRAIVSLNLNQIKASKIMEWDESLWVVDAIYPGYSNAHANSGGGFDVVKPKWKVHVKRR